MRLFYEDELRRKSFYEMYQIAIDEKLIENYITNPTREEIINIILKYRGAKPTNTITTSPSVSPTSAVDGCPIGAQTQYRPKCQQCPPQTTPPPPKHCSCHRLAAKMVKYTYKP